MAGKNWTKHNHYIEKLCYDGEKVIDSECFRDLKYLIKDGHIVLISNSGGKLALKFDVLPELIKELEEMRETWGSIKTKNCLF